MCNKTYCCYGLSLTASLLVRHPLHCWCVIRTKMCPRVKWRIVSCYRRLVEKKYFLTPSPLGWTTPLFRCSTEIDSTGHVDLPLIVYKIWYPPPPGVFPSDTTTPLWHGHMSTIHGHGPRLTRLAVEFWDPPSRRPSIPGTPYRLSVSVPARRAKKF